MTLMIGNFIMDT